MFFFLIECKDILNAMFEHLLLKQNWEITKLSYYFNSAMWKKENYLPEAGADPRIMKFSSLLKLGLGKN